MNQFLSNTVKRLLLILSLSICFALSANAESIEVDGVIYDLNTSDRTASVTGTNTDNLPVDVVIPPSVTYYNVPFSVTTIANKAFRFCTNMQSISIPASVVQIGTNKKYDKNSDVGNSLPFENCSGLKSVRFEDSPTPISLSVDYSSYSSDYGKGAFYYCPLEEVYIGRDIAYQYNGYSLENNPGSYGKSCFGNQSMLTKVTIGEKVTEILPYLFTDNQSLTILSLPHVVKIGLRAFQNCKKLTTLNFGDALEIIDNNAFYECENITKITLPNSIQSIGDEAFFRCTSVTEVTVGSNLNSIGIRAFYQCGSFTAIILPDNFKSMGESAFESCTKLTIAKLGNSIESIPRYAFKNCPALSEMIIPGSAQSIGNQAFYNDSGLATITMNEGLKAIYDEAFWNNSGILRFTIPGTVTYIGTNCFYGCTNVSYLIFNDGDEDLKIANYNCRSVKSNSIGQWDYFYDCPIRFITLGRNLDYVSADKQTSVNASGPFVNKTELRSVTIGPKVTYLNHHLFDGCTNLSTLRMGSAVETIRTYAFSNCDALKSVDFPSTIKSIDSFAFYNCDLLASTTYHDASDRTLSIGDNTFEQCNQLSEISFPGNLASLGKTSFLKCVGLKSTYFRDKTYPDLKLLIDDSAFNECSFLESVSFCPQLSKIGNSSFSKCLSLNNIEFRDDPLYQIDLTIGNWTFNDCISMNSLRLPGRLLSIGDCAFENCSFLMNLTFEDSKNAVTLGDGWHGPLFGKCNLEKLYLGRNIDYSYNPIPFKYYSPFSDQKFLTDVTFSHAGTVTYCKDYLLYKVNKCEELILPESLTSIGSYTFAEMTALKGITIPDKVSTMGTYAFSADHDLKYAKLSTGCNWLKEGAFSDCDSLSEIVIPSVVTKMDTKLFANCKSLATVTFESGSDLIEMGYGASQSEYGMFRDCPVETLNLDRWLSYNTSMDSRSPFYSIPSLKNINIGENVKVIDKYMFSYCTGLEDIYLPDNIESVGLWGFRGCTALKDVRLSNRLSQISDYGFSECSLLDNVVFPASMTSVADNSFSNCSALKRLDLGKNLLIIGPAAFKNDTALESIVIPETLYGLGVEAFANCTSLPNVTIRAISSVGKQAFQGCTGLKWVSLSDNTTSLGENSFADCTGIKYIKSYADFPPEGLVNFPADVVANGTLFVPEFSVDYYQYSPTWEDWYNIRTLNENIMVSSVALDKTEISLKAAESVQLSAVVGADDATDKSILWQSSDDDIVSVDHNGLLTAIAVGQAYVTAIAADGSGEKSICSVSVIPTLVESIAINSPVSSLKKGRSLEVYATVAPASATNSSISWSSSNPAIASVNSDGVISAVSAGSVNITATASDGSGVSSSFILSVVPPIKGDSNDNDMVTVADAVNTANYAVGIDVPNFNHEAADVNADNRITLADASATIAIVLDQSLSATTIAKSRSCSDINNSDADLLVVDNYSVNADAPSSLFVYLDNSVDYVALQADIILPDGISLQNVKIGDRAEAYHSLSVNSLDDHSLRFTLFDINNAVFSDNDGALLELVVKAESNATGDVVLNNCLASDADANEYILSSIGGHNADLSGVNSIIDCNISIQSVPGAINILNAKGSEVIIYDVYGSVIACFVASSDLECRHLASGVYVVVAGNMIEKVMINQ